MSRLFGILTFVVLLGSADAAFGQERLRRQPRPAPELSGAGAAAALVLVGGAAAIMLGRRRARKS